MDIVARAKKMISSPAEEWPVVAGESSSVGALYQGYIMQLSAIPPIATLIGGLLFRGVGFGSLLLLAITFYILGLIGVYIVALIAAKLAPMFGGTDNTESGLKLVAYGSTSAWVGGVFHIVPALSVLSLLASVYGIYLYYTGVTPVMKVPTGRAVGYLIALVIAVIVVYVVIFGLVGAIAGAGMGMMM